MEWFANDANSNNSDDFNQGTLAFAEAVWVALDRPYYNVWPIAVSLATSVGLNLRFSQIRLQDHAILLRFAKGHEPDHLRTALVFRPKGMRTIQVFSHFADEGDSLLTVQNAYEPEDTVEDWLVKLEQHKSGLADHQHSAGVLMVRMMVFISLLSQGEDLITPVVLSKDRVKYESTEDPDVRQWIEERAARRAGRGFDVGKRLQFQKDESPHWRNPHLCLFWTGEGRITPIIQMRSGSVVQRVSMADVPTGYMGPETSEEDATPDLKTARESISKSRRFEIMKRDGFRCQLCGATQGDGVILHVDHRVPLAKGGSYKDENLWTLCEPCNLGKSDKMLN